MSKRSDEHNERGKGAELLVADYLRNNGHKVLEMNWRTRWCEVDVISTKKKCAYLTEVKFRSSDEWGTGLDYITKKKLAQMHFAAEFWISSSHWSGEVQLLAAQVDASNNVTIIEI